jgi:hypothetical protein
MKKGFVVQVKIYLPNIAKVWAFCAVVPVFECFSAFLI